MYSNKEVIKYPKTARLQALSNGQIAHPQ